MIAVVGSVNRDLALSVDELPAAGSTVAAGPVHRGLGGKGANQAVALARLGRPVAMVGAVGDDLDGDLLRDALAAEGIDVGAVARVDGPSGTAIVIVHGGESTILFSSGANGLLDAARVHDVAAVVSGADAVVAQCEVPDEALVAAAELARGLFVVNPAPARPLPAAVLDRADVLVPNAGELATLAGLATPDPADTDALADLAGALRPGRATVVTCGSAGAVVVDDGVVQRVPVVPAELVDATAAGDSFVAALTDALLDGASLLDAAGWAARVASVTVSRAGASDALPFREDVPDLPGSASRAARGRSAAWDQRGQAAAPWRH
ncbi:MAG: hypothetical protein ABS81_20230 [Pseudonocardia sp. SCN 72-86]|nr:MAG: hypothetical protein ABS81_20230 [Pseudonocardia sp. SCN 72-86]